MSGEEQQSPPAVERPTMPTETVLRNSATFYRRRADGVMELAFCPVATLPGGQQALVPEAFVIEFHGDAWERFKREVLADGVKPPTIETVQGLPPGLRNGG